MELSMISIIIALVSVVIFVLVLWNWKLKRVFNGTGIKCPPIAFPLLGHMMPTMRQKVHFKDFVKDMYDCFPNERYSGMVQFGKPFIILRDIELIKQVAIKDFDHFTDHMSTLDEGADIIFGNSLFSLQGQKWRDMRATLSPAFTSSKMRGMYPFVVDCGERMAKYFIEEMKTEENRVRGLIEVEMKDVFTRYANDVIATCAFGIEVDSFNNKTNQFYEMAKEVSNFSGIRFIMSFFALLILPRISKILGVKIFSKRVQDYYRDLIWGTIKYRQNNNVVRQDMIQLLMEARKGTLNHEVNDDGKEAGFATVEESDVGKVNVKRAWTDDEIVAQAMLFILAGFDTSSTLLCFMAHELALNPSIQKRLQEEIDEVAASTNGKLTYECLQKMKYLDMVVSETLRKWPPAVQSDRKCLKPYKLPPANDIDGKPYQMIVGEGLWIPIYPLHHDPQYFKDPETFDPERFSDENKHNIKPFTYLPFGIGPRNCIGSRFALMEVKAVIYNLLLKFDIVTTAKTQHPIKLSLKSFNMYSEKGFWVGLKLRNK